MTDRSEELLAGALTLTQKQRAKLVEDLIESLESPPTDYATISKEEFVAELDRRSAELREHSGLGVPWEQGKSMR